jgi:hypothetical protein
MRQKENTMNEFTRFILSLPRLPGKIGVEIAAILAGFKVEDMTILARRKLLVPLNAYGTNTPKVYATDDVLAFAANRELLAKATRAVYEANRAKNSGA